MAIVIDGFCNQKFSLKDFLAWDSALLILSLAQFAAKKVKRAQGLRNRYAAL